MIKPSITKDATSGVYGFVDSIDEKGISGWILDLDGGVNVVEVYINNVKVGEKEANLYREDIDKITGKVTNCGFFIAWKEVKINTDILSSAGFKLEILHSRTKDIIAGQYVMNSAGSIGGKGKLKQDVKICKSETSEDFISIMKNCDSENYRETEVFSMNMTLYKLNALKGGIGLVCFVHYDRDDILDDCVKNYISSLRSFGYDIVFVTTSNIDMAKNYDFIKENCAMCIIRENIGYDFYSYAIFYTMLRIYLNLYNTFIFANDSVYLISEELLHIFLQKLNRKLFEQNMDCIGALSSCERAYHIQSWFVAFKISEDILRFMDDFVRNISVQNNKENIINCYEVGISQKLIQNGFKIGAVYEYNDLVVALEDNHPYCEHVRKHYANPSHFFWDKLINSDFPFIKRELLVKNPSKIVNIGLWKNLCVNKGNRNFIKAIENNIRRLLNGNSVC